jgi:hypothetical protein
MQITKHTEISPLFVQAAGEPVSAVVIHDDMHGILFLELASGKVTIYNIQLNQALKRRFDSIQAARDWAIHVFMDRL